VYIWYILCSTVYKLDKFYLVVHFILHWNKGCCQTFYFCVAHL